MAFSLFKKNIPHPHNAVWNMTTNDQELTDPTWEEIKNALANAHEGSEIFLTLECLTNEKGLKVLQALGSNEGGIVYRLEAIPCNLEEESYYYRENLSYQETLDYFQEFFDTFHIDNFSYWPREQL